MIALALVLAVATPAICTGLAVERAWIREAPPGASVMAAYAQIENRGSGDRSLLGGQSPRFGAVELHRTVVSDGISRMRHGEPLTIPAGGRAALVPGDWHLMLMRPDPHPASGEQVPVTLEFEDCTLEATFTVGGIH